MPATRRIACCFLLALAAAPGLAAGDLERAVATVNGVAVTAREFVEAQRRLHYRFEDDARGLRTAALAECVDFQVRLQMARARGLIGDTTDAFVRTAYAAENQRRLDAKAAGQPVFGPVQLTWAQFRSYWLDGVERQLREAINREAGPETEDELRQFYKISAAQFTAPHEKEPRPFAELVGHVRDKFRQARYEGAVHEAIHAAKVESDDAFAATLSPRTPL